MLQDLKNRGHMLPISFNTKPTIGKKPDKKRDSLRVDIKTHPWEISSKKVSIYIPISRTGSEKSLLKFIFLLKKILKGQNLITGPQYYTTTKNIIAGDSLKKIEHEFQETVNKIMTNYNFFMKCLKTNLFH